MKWPAKLKSFPSRYFEIEEDSSVGFYLYVFENGKCIYDHLQDTFEIAVECAWKDYEVPKNAWEKVRECFMDNDKSSYNCRVCGLFQDEDVPPWGLDGNCPSFNICDCCGVEFGYQDCFPEAVQGFRKEWLNKGGHWCYPEEKPSDWSLEEQLKNIPKKYL